MPIPSNHLPFKGIRRSQLREVAQAPHRTDTILLGARPVHPEVSLCVESLKDWGGMIKFKRSTKIGNDKVKEG